MPNRLAAETSPYLLQHKDNPVDWYPWGDEAFERARREDKPVLLSVGYSACHWCHVMAHESFEDPSTAALMNELYVNIKVDREERPDVDAIYMQAVQSLTGGGGWPMTVFLTPDGHPFYGGTYYPPEERPGMPSFKRVLTSIHEIYVSRRADVERSAGEIQNHLSAFENVRPGAQLLTDELLHRAASLIGSSFDARNGGFARAPKFPQPMTLEFLLRYHARTADPSALSMVELTLQKMARGGMYDQIGGGFHRYSTDAVWLVPHFEKMLYDNALLARVYLDAYRVTGNRFYRRVTEETLDYVLREMTGPEGGFYSTQDADSEGEEGKFFLWTPEEVAAAAGDHADLLLSYFGVTANGNFEGRNILTAAEDAAFASEHGLALEDWLDIRLDARRRLYDVRQARIHPGRDEKVLTSWDGMMLRAFAEAGFVFGDERYTAAAVRNADFLLANLIDDGGRVLRTWKDGRARLKGYLEDYAHLIDGLLAVYQATFDLEYLARAIALAHHMLRLFWDDSAQGFFDTGADHEALIARPRDFFDNATPSGNSTAADVLLRLAAITGDGDFERKAIAAIRALAPIIERAPTGFGRLLSALDFHLSRPQELAIVYPASRAEAKSLIDVALERFRPQLSLVGAPEGQGAELTPLLAERSAVDGQATAYLCECFTCKLPVTDAQALRDQLAGLT
jgi:uncharacterized protein YyaL (SSP411 family)